MQKLTIGGDELTLVASPITLWIYKKAFGTDLVGDFMAMASAEQDDGSIDLASVGLLDLIQMAWAMAKTASPGKMPEFPAWLESLPDDALDFTTLDVTPIAAEVKRGFFRQAKGETATPEHSDVDAE